MISTATMPRNSSGYTIAPPYCSSLKALRSSFITKASYVVRYLQSSLLSPHGRPMERRKIPLYSAVERAARTILRGENADPAAVANLVGAVVEIDYRGAHFHRAGAGQNQAFSDAGVDLDVVRQVSCVGEAASEPAAVYSVHAEREPKPVVDCAGRGGEGLIVIEEDVVTTDVFEFSGRKIELPGLDLGALRDAVVKVFVQIQIFVSVRAGLLDLIYAALGVVEGLENQRRAELSLVYQVGSLLVV